MLYLAAIITAGYYLRFIFYFRRMFPPRKGTLGHVLAITPVILALYGLSGYINVRPFSIILLISPMILGLRLLTGMNWLQSIYGACISVLVAYSCRGILTPIISAFLPSQYDIALLDSRYYYMLTALTLPTAILYFEIIRRTIAPDATLQRLLENRTQLKTVVLFEVSLIVFLIMLNHGRFVEQDISWYMALLLMSCLTSLAVLTYILHHAIRVCELIEYERHTHLLEEQFNRQLRHYKAYQKFTESYRAFRHDYASMVSSIKALLRGGEYEAAIQFMDEVTDTMQASVQVHQTYSDNIVLDAMLQDIANLCQEYSIDFKAIAHIPKDTSLTMVEAIRIFSNLTGNALEACQKVPAGKRFLHIYSSNTPAWATLEVQNSFCGELRQNSKEYLTTKSEENLHGFGLKIVRSTVEGMGGILHLEPDVDKHVFLARVHIPRHPKDTPPEKDDGICDRK